MRSYSNIAIALHWLTVLILGFMVSTGYSMDQLAPESKAAILSQHASAGIVFLLLAIARLLWRLGHTPGSLPESVPNWQVKVVHFTHAIFYVLMVFVPITGLLAASAHSVPASLFGFVNLQGLVGPTGDTDFDLRYAFHKLGVETLLFLVILHVGAAFTHLVAYRDRVFHRMLPRISRRKTIDAASK